MAVPKKSLTRLPRLLYLVLPSLVASTSYVAWAQGPLPLSLPSESSASDVDEVEEVVPDTETLLRDESLDEDDSTEPQTDRGKPRVANLKSIKKAQAEELSYSQGEVRSRFAYAASVALGTAMPWQSYSLDFERLLGTNWAAGLYVGAGSFNDSGKVDEQAFDLKIKSRSAGITGRYFFNTFDRLSLQTSLAYATWSGSISPNSANDEEDTENELRLGASFDASGFTSGFAAVLTWLWDDGFYIAWTPAGIRKSWVVQKDQSRDAADADKLIRQKISDGSFFGVTNLRFGWLF